MLTQAWRVITHGGRKIFIRQRSVSSEENVFSKTLAGLQVCVYALCQRGRRTSAEWFFSIVVMPEETFNDWRWEAVVSTSSIPLLAGVIPQSGLEQTRSGERWTIWLRSNADAQHGDPGDTIHLEHQFARWRPPLKGGGLVLRISIILVTIILRMVHHMRQCFKFHSLHPTQESSCRFFNDCYHLYA